MIKISDLHAKWMKDEEYRREYEALEEEFALTRALMDVRFGASLTQDQAASPSIQRGDTDRGSC